MSNTLLEVNQLSVTIDTDTVPGSVKLLDSISFSVAAGQSVGLVGESGCGKSLTALAIMGLLPTVARASGRIAFHPQADNLLTLSESEYCRIRGHAVAMVFQEPLTALNPVQTIGAQVAEGIRLQLKLSRSEAARRARQLLDRVGLPAARFSAQLYPHQLSGGQRQRVVIAIALACQPRLLIADEPTTALDVQVQAQILDLIQEIVDEYKMGLLLITHDLAVIAETVAQVNVMYAGRIVEQGDTVQLFETMAHPYTRGLFAAMPSLGRHAVTRLKTIPGTVPEPLARPAGCGFSDRCEFVQACCRAAPPMLTSVVPNQQHLAACYFPFNQQASIS